MISYKEFAEQIGRGAPQSKIKKDWEIWFRENYSINLSNSAISLYTTVYTTTFLDNTNIPLNIYYNELLSKEREEKLNQILNEK